MMKQSLELAKQPHVVIATPGRLAGHLQTAHSFSLKKIKFLVKSYSDQRWSVYACVFVHVCA